MATRGVPSRTQMGQEPVRRVTAFLTSLLLLKSKPCISASSIGHWSNDQTTPLAPLNRLRVPHICEVSKQL